MDTQNARAIASLEVLSNATAALAAEVAESRARLDALEGNWTCATHHLEAHVAGQQERVAALEAMNDNMCAVFQTDAEGSCSMAPRNQTAMMLIYGFGPRGD